MPSIKRNAQGTKQSALANLKNTLHRRAAPYYPGTPVLNGRSAHWVKGKLVDRAENIARMAAQKLHKRKRPQDQSR